MLSSSPPRVVMRTNLGEIEFELHSADAPETVKNFLALTRKQFYDGTTFHRVIRGFMIQGGDPLGDGTGGPGYTFADEINARKIVRGSLAMANAGPNTNGGQFFITTAAATPWLDGKHTNFGTVVRGMDVVDRIATVAVDGMDRPEQPVTVERMRVRNRGSILWERLTH